MVLIKTITKSNFKLLLLAIFFIAFSTAFAQAPKISYQTPQTYIVNTSITPLSPTNTGGAVPANVYGQVTTLAGNGTAGAADGRGKTASFNSPHNIATDVSGNIYVADNGNDKIREITPQGVVSTLAGNGTPGAINGKGPDVSFTNPNGLTVDAAGNVYIADSGNQLIRKISITGVVTTIAGNGSVGSSDGTTQATFNFPNDVIMDNAGNIYVSDYVNDEIRKISPTGTVSTLAGYPILGKADGTGSNARFWNPGGLTIDANGNLYVTDDSNDLIRKVTPAGVVTTIAGTGLAGSTDGNALSASFKYPTSITFDQLGNMYIADTFNHIIRKIDANGVVSTFAGVSGVPGFSDNSNPTLATFDKPYGVVADGLGNLYVSDEGNSAIRKINLTGYTIDKALPSGLTFDATTGIISGTPSFYSPPTNYTITAYNNEGSSTTAVNIEVSSPVTMTIIPTKTICSPDFTPLTGGGNGVYTYTSSSPAVAKIVAGKVHILGPGTTNITASDGSSSASQILSVDISITPLITITPDGSGTCQAQSLTYTASVINGGIDPIYQWQVNNKNVGTNTNYITTTTLQTNDQISCLLTDTSDCTAGAVRSNVIILTTNLYVTPAVSIQSSVSGPVSAGTDITFTATPTNGGSDPLYQWAINGVNTGTNSPTFTHNCFADGDTVTCILNSRGIKCVFPSSVQSKAITVNVVISNKASVIISASANNVYAGSPVTFTATITGGDGSPSYIWFINNQKAGPNSATFTTNRLYNGDIVTCTATDGACNVPVTSNAISMMILPPLSFTIPNTFTPNGDSINDFWDIPYLNYYQNCTVSIFSRYGIRVFYSKGYPKPWDGTYNGSKLPVGTYYYIINLANITPQLSGYVTIIR